MVQQTTVIKEVVRYHKPPTDLLSDHSPQFIAQSWKSFWKQLGVDVSLTSGCHPQSNGQTKRINQELVKYLRYYCSRHLATWLSTFYWLTTNSIAPLHACFRLRPTLITHMPGVLRQLLPGPIPLPTSLFIVCNGSGPRYGTHSRCPTRQIRSRLTVAEAPLSSFNGGDLVYVFSKSLPGTSENHKLGDQFVGPFKIVNPVAYQLSIPRYTSRHSARPIPRLCTYPI